MKIQNLDFEKVHFGKSELLISQNKSCATSEVVEDLLGLLATFLTQRSGFSGGAGYAIAYYVGLALGSEKCKLKVKISRHSKPNLTTEVKLLEAGYCKFPFRSIIKINKRQSALHTDGTIVRWMAA